jgi:hypothetical protein
MDILASSNFSISGERDRHRSQSRSRQHDSKLGSTSKNDPAGSLYSQEGPFTQFTR